MKKQVTFDIFDTLVTRAVPTPGVVFDLLELRFCDAGHGWAKGFAEARREAERLDRQELPQGADTSLERIYAKLSKDIGMDGGSVEMAMEAEVQLEVDVARPLEEGLVKLRRAREEGSFAGYISDMYLSSSAIRRILEKCGVWQEGDRLWVSCETGVTKSSGKMFSVVQGEAGLEPASWVHVGDHPRSDVRVPEGMGMRVDPVSEKLGEGREKVLEAGGMEEGLLARGAVVRARREGRARGLEPRLERLWDLGARVGGPMIYWFVEGVLERAIAAGKTDLWFLARDGQVMWRVAKELVKARGLEIGVHYVAASRQAWHLPSMREMGESEKRWILANADSLTMEDVLQRLHVDGEDGEFLRGELVGAGVPSEGGVGGSLEVIWEVLCREDVLERLLAKAGEEREIARDYLMQFRGGGSVGIVDIGWGGNMQASLESILEGTEWVEGLKGWYLGLWSLNPRLEAERVESLMFDPQTEGLAEWKQLVPLLELFCSGTHAGVIGYERRGDGTVGEVLAPEESWAAQLEWGIQVLQDSIVVAAQLMNAEGCRLDGGSVRALVRGFGAGPEEDEVALLADWPCQSEQNRTRSREFVPRLGLGDCWRALRGVHFHPVNWRNGAIRLNGTFRYGIYSICRRFGLRFVSEA